MEPEVDEYWPAAHFSHEVVPNCPALQGQSDRAFAAAVEHVRQLEAPVDGPKWPTLQSEHDTAPTVEY